MRVRTFLFAVLFFNPLSAYADLFGEWIASGGEAALFVWIRLVKSSDFVQETHLEDNPKSFEAILARIEIAAEKSLRSRSNFGSYINLLVYSPIGLFYTT
ncbi:MAG: hypothetical protein HYT37_00685 [Candidatus Sungbacteria bacterium]|nr:hypothetical protein [Candidatus Sungbacteria bacterium]